MATINYKSANQEVNASSEKVFSFFSDLKNVERMYRNFPSDKLGMVQNVEFSEDSMKVKIDGVGPRFEINLVERVENSRIGYELADSQLVKQMKVNLCIEPADFENKCSIYIEMAVDLPVFVKMMYGSKIQPALDKAVKLLANLPYTVMS